MKRLVAALCFACVLALTANAQPSVSKKKHVAADKRKTVMKALLAKYDTNKDGKLEKSERAKMTAKDKARFKKLEHARKKKAARRKAKASA